MLLNFNNNTRYFYKNITILLGMWFNKMGCIQAGACKETLSILTYFVLQVFLNSQRLPIMKAPAPTPVKTHNFAPFLSQFQTIDLEFDVLVRSVLILTDKI